MNKENDLIKKIKKISDPFKQKLYFIGILTKLLEKEKLTPIIVGGYALEFYTAGGYNTVDIDVIFSDNKLLDSYLKKLNFVRIGRGWFNKELDILIESPGSSLELEEKKNLTEVKIKDVKVYIIGLEDLIIDRLNAYIYWQSNDDGYWVKELLGLFAKKINWEYLRKKLKKPKMINTLNKLWKEVKKKYLNKKENNLP